MDMLRHSPRRAYAVAAAGLGSARFASAPSRPGQWRLGRVPLVSWRSDVSRSAVRWSASCGSRTSRSGGYMCRSCRSTSSALLHKPDAKIATLGGSKPVNAGAATPDC